MKIKLGITIVVLVLLALGFMLNVRNRSNERLTVLEKIILNDTNMEENNNSLLSYVVSEYKVKLLKDMHFDSDLVSIFGFIQPEKQLVMRDKTGIVIYDLETDNLIQTSKVGLTKLQIFGSKIYGINTNERLVRIDAKTLESKEVVSERVYSYIVTSEGISYQTVDEKKQQAFLVLNDKRLHIPDIRVVRRHDNSLNPALVSWAPNGKYALYFEDKIAIEGDGEENKSNLYLADIEKNTVKVVDSTMNFIIKWHPDSNFFMAGKRLSSADIFNRKTLARIGSFHGTFDEYMLLNNYLYGVHIIRDSRKPRCVILRHDIQKGGDKIIFKYDDILNLNYIKKDLFAFRDFSNSSIYIISEDGKVKAQFNSPESHQILSWDIDSNGYITIGSRVKDKYLVRIYKIDF